MKELNEFKKAYSACKTYGDWERLFKSTNKGILHQIEVSMDFVNKTTGLDMRQESFLNNLKSYNKFCG